MENDRSALFPFFVFTPMKATGNDRIYDDEDENRSTERP